VLLWTAGVKLAAGMGVLVEDPLDILIELLVGLVAAAPGLAAARQPRFGRVTAPHG